MLREAHDLNQTELITIAETTINIIRNRTDDSEHIDELAALIDQYGCLNDEPEE